MDTTRQEKIRKVEELLKALHEGVGDTHTVELHPHQETLYRIKNQIESSKKGTMHISNIKKLGLSSKVVDAIPKTKSGHITAEDIDNHLESLPKTKMNVNITPYSGWGGQQMHRRDNTEYVMTAGLHPNEKQKMSANSSFLFDTVKDHDHTHRLRGSVNDMVGWVRIDPNTNKNINNDENHKKNDETAHDHWHLDEIQSDLQNHSKINERSGDAHFGANHGDEVQTLLGHLSHGFDDPQHALHAAALQLGRKLGVKSTSMDMPDDQQRKSMLLTENRKPFKPNPWIDKTKFGRDDYRRETTKSIKKGHIATDEHKEELWSKEGRKTVADSMHDKDFASGAQKLGGMEGLKEFAEVAHHGVEGPTFRGEHGEFHDASSTGNHKFSDNMNDKFKLLSNDEKNSLSEFLLRYHGKARDTVPMDKILSNHNKAGAERYKEAMVQYKKDLEEFEESGGSTHKKPPVHQINTYKKRPKKMGYVPVDKDELLGEYDGNTYNGDQATQVQYAKLHKKLASLRDLLKGDKWKN